MNELSGVGLELREFLCQNGNCGKQFQMEVGVVDNRPMSISRLCPSCQEKEDLEEYAHQKRSNDTRSTLDIMADLGLNTRKHGTLADGRPATLESLGGEEAVQVGIWVDDVIGAGRHDLVRGLYLEGPTGTGKTQLCAAAVRRLLGSGYEATRIVYDRARALVTTVQDRYRNGSVGQVLDERRLAGVWILDDIGTEKETADAYRILEDLLDAREGHPTLLSSNLSRANLAKRWATADTEGRLRSRLGPENFQHISVRGEDRRFVGR